MGLISYDFNRKLNLSWAFRRLAPYEEREAGAVIFCGRQGMGKTTSLAEYILTLKKKYGDKLCIYSNLPLSGLDYTAIMAEDVYDLKCDPGLQNVIIIDEISSIFSALSSSKLDGRVYQCFCQLRKRGALVVGTAQRFDRISTAIREQCNIIVDCRRIGRLQFNRVFNIEVEESVETLPKMATFYYFFPTQEIYNLFDSSHIIKRKSEVMAHEFRNVANLR